MSLFVIQNAKKPKKFFSTENRINSSFEGFLVGEIPKIFKSKKDAAYVFQLNDKIFTNKDPKDPDWVIRKIVVK